MAINKLLPFANGDQPNVLDYATWNALPGRVTGFQSGIANSKQFNYILAQGGAAGYVIGQLVADELNLDAPSTARRFTRTSSAPSRPSSVQTFRRAR